MYLVARRRSDNSILEGQHFTMENKSHVESTLKLNMKNANISDEDYTLSELTLEEFMSLANDKPQQETTYQKIARLEEQNLIMQETINFLLGL